MHKCTLCTPSMCCADFAPKTTVLPCWAWNSVAQRECKIPLLLHLHFVCYTQNIRYTKHADYLSKGDLPCAKNAQSLRMAPFQAHQHVAPGHYASFEGVFAPCVHHSGQLNNYPSTRVHIGMPCEGRRV